MPVMKCFSWCMDHISSASSYEAVLRVASSLKKLPSLHAQLSSHQVMLKHEIQLQDINIFSRQTRFVTNVHGLMILKIRYAFVLIKKRHAL